MALATLQIVALLFTAVQLMKFKRVSRRYRFGVSLLASCWAGASVALAVAMILNWPEAMEQTTALSAMSSVASAVAAWACRGNVAELLRMLRRCLPWRALRS